MDELRTSVRSWIMDFIASYCRENGVESIWKEPVVGLADARSHLFGELKVTAYPEHKVPSDYLEDAVTVISYFLPFEEGLADRNMVGDRPTMEWAEAYRLTNTMASSLNNHIAEQIGKMGHRAVVPTDTSLIEGTTYSHWSQRHVARIAGLGSFGMNNMLISESGCCGRYFSIVTDVPCVHDDVCGERCLYKLNGSCGLCMDACICGALTPEGFDREACWDVCSTNIGIVGSDVCGKCIAGMPCAFTDPSK